MPLELLFPPSLGELRGRVRAELLEPWFDKQLGEVARVRVADSYAELEEKVLVARPHIAWAPPVLVARARSITRAVLTAVRHGRSAYRSALVGRAEDGLSLSSLEGLRAVWVDRLSAAGYQLPVEHLRKHGLEPHTLFASQEFAGSYRAALDAVLAGDADVATIYTSEPDEESVRTALAECLDTQRARLAPFAYTDEAPNDGLLFTKRLSHEAVVRLLRDLAPFAMEGPNLLLSVLGAERLERGDPEEYGTLL